MSWGQKGCVPAERCYWAIWIVARYRNALPLQVSVLLMRSVALVHLDYCSSVLSGADAISCRWRRLLVYALFSICR